jgi:hypothetical protein
MRLTPEAYPTSVCWFDRERALLVARPLVAKPEANGFMDRRHNGAMHRRGTVWIAPEDPVPPGYMADPVTSTFWVSWQHDEEGLLGHGVVIGADEAIAWGRERAEVIRIRLGHTDDTHFSAGDTRAQNLPLWPPQHLPPGGWWSPGDPRGDWPVAPAAPGQLGVSSPQTEETREPSDGC